MKFIGISIVVYYFVLSIVISGLFVEYLLDKDKDEDEEEEGDEK